jgi:drug/metabolite transporter (DMT)-like permease
MMPVLFLIGSVVLSSYLTISFKVCERYKVHTFQAIVFNYITCVITGSVVNGAFPIKPAVFSEAYFQWAMVMGVLFITLFNMIGFTAQKIGVAVASVANKLSLIIPILLAIYLYGETVRGWKLVGIVLALIAVVLTSYQNKDQGAHKDAAGRKWAYLLPFVLFVGSGLLDSLINHVQKLHVTPATNNAFLISGFFSAACIGSIVMLIGYFTKRFHFQWKNLLAGVLIGIPNYFSIWCLVQYLQQSPWQSSASIPVNNMGIVLFSTLVAWLLFKEALSKINWLGIALAMVAIYFIAFGDQL